MERLDVFLNGFSKQPLNHLCFFFRAKVEDTRVSTGGNEEYPAAGQLLGNKSVAVTTMICRDLKNIGKMHGFEKGKFTLIEEDFVKGSGT